MLNNQQARSLLVLVVIIIVVIVLVTAVVINFNTKLVNIAGLLSHHQFLLLTVALHLLPEFLPGLGLLLLRVLFMGDLVQLHKMSCTLFSMR